MGCQYAVKSVTWALSEACPSEGSEDERVQAPRTRSLNAFRSIMQVDQARKRSTGHRLGRVFGTHNPTGVLVGRAQQHGTDGVHGGGRWEQNPFEWRNQAITNRPVSPSMSGNRCLIINL